VKSNAALGTLQIAKALVAGWRTGKLLETGQHYWADSVVSIEPFEGDMARLEGKSALAEKGRWWLSAHEVHSFEVGEPFVNGDSFIVRFVFDVTVRETGRRSTLDEWALYVIKDDQIIEERFFVPEQYFGR
jgi:hypothetical protein